MFNMSMAAALAGGVIVAIRQAKRIPKRATVFLWLIPFCRMAVPVGLNSPYSLVALLTRVTVTSVAVYRPAENAAVSMMNFAKAAATYFPITYKASALGAVFGAASVIWLTGFLAILLLLAVTYVITLRELKDAVHLRRNIYASDKIVTPGVYGILQPKIVLPAARMAADTELILLHEAMHIRRKDNLWRVVGFLAVAVHWFNPLCWVFLKLFLEDLEMSCDECVLGRLGKDRAKEYALSLLESKQSAAVFTSAFGGAKIRTRIEHILSFRKMTKVSLVVFILLITTVAWLLLTNPG